MKALSRKTIALIAISVLMVVFKLFTAVVYVADDPTVLFALRTFPSLQNKLVSTQLGIRSDRYTFIANGENALVGQDLYFFLVDWGIPVAVLAFLVLAVRELRVRN